MVDSGLSSFQLVRSFGVFRIGIEVRLRSFQESLLFCELIGCRVYQVLLGVSDGTKTLCFALFIAMRLSDDCSVSLCLVRCFAQFLAFSNASLIGFSIDSLCSLTSFASFLASGLFSFASFLLCKTSSLAFSSFSLASFSGILASLTSISLTTIVLSNFILSHVLRFASEGMVLFFAPTQLVALLFKNFVAFFIFNLLTVELGEEVQVTLSGEVASASRPFLAVWNCARRHYNAYGSNRRLFGHVEFGHGMFQNLRLRKGFALEVQNEGHDFVVISALVRIGLSCHEIISSFGVSCCYAAYCSRLFVVVKLFLTFF